MSNRGKKNLLLYFPLCCYSSNVTCEIDISTYAFDPTIIVYANQY
jgi:hypothetical protein